MARAASRDKGEGPSSHKTRKSHQKKPYDSTGNDGSNVPGAQKIKSAIRQTKRLLAKDNLAADLRVETERRLKSLESDLVLAERRKKERAYALKYHKIKFFERQKLTRKIKQVKAQLDAKGSAQKLPTTELENTLYELRVDLNYILHYPRLERYISLFPPSVRQRRDDDADSEHPESDEDESADSHVQTSNDLTEQKRMTIRDDIKARMENGELSQTPELDVENSKGTRKERLDTKVLATVAPAKKQSRNGTKGERDKASERDRGDNDRPKEANAGVGDDDFFVV